MSILDLLNNTSAIALGALLSAIASWIFARRTIPRSHRVAVIGFPQAGKTSLIVSVFAYYFRRGVRGAAIIPRGEETIRRVNMHMAEMESGKGVSPTRDQDLFAFRAEIHRRSVIPLLESRYKLEIGDFPGEQSEEFIESKHPWLHNTNYFEWAMGADAFIFVVDAAKVINFGPEYVSHQKSAFRAAIQRIEESHIDGKRGLKDKSAVLVYSKADVVLELAQKGSLRDYQAKQLKSSLDEQFRDLIEYFQRSIPTFKTVVTSVLDTDSERRLGIDEVANLILPRAT
jgi:predicted YcjX-like family ATPase